MNQPLVSVLLCTHNSRELLPIAIESYLSQDYSSLELVVIDDGDDPIEDVVKNLPGIHYCWFPAQNLSQKRNEGVRRSAGEAIVHFDSDDWSGEGRISHQIEALGDRKVIGYSKSWWYDMQRKVASYASCGVWGASLCYDRRWAIAHPWDETLGLYEDVYFIHEASELGVLGEIEGLDNFVALCHAGNIQRPFGAQGWEIAPSSSLPPGFPCR